MTHFLITDDKPDGHTLEGILAMIRGDMIKRAVLIIDDDRPEARKVLANNVQIMSMLTECIALADENTAVLTKAFGPSREGEPRIGIA
ncbi:MAG: histidine kinase [Alphaproteobacteria bacterium]|nr:histidine kinase [Alphaproteobacteria bacterium]